ncbi:CoA pyrophosphatase [Roseibium denhamense]|uniref:8-oxo-dGTP pyrophosphatase MutT, NUDIX family n=1 Tax=Roseibium denhamense TaxID=76305 RepID=A0ABY1NFM5_9HYPH|nr:CoA pyrophosphatase [Roseibium denhamense]MTI06346.1 CoA pyrophosphatase [Roseibium denhamense]SMP08472.1 8-oxo-dGTP pyrophosphatase MutT, NUDIX family [Roseibium denhamense]
MPEFLVPPIQSHSERLARIRARLADPGYNNPVMDTGDHVLNPGLGPYAKWKGAPKDAAVLIGIVNRETDQRVVLTERTRHLSSHAGQVAFPGGKIDAEDTGPEAAALREAEEEIGLPPSQVSVLGRLAPYLTGSGYKVVPVVGLINAEAVLTPNPEEVEKVFEVPLDFLLDPSNHTKSSREWKGHQRFFYEMPYEGHYIWGVTAGIIRSFYETVDR